MALSEHEQRMFEQMERELRGEVKAQFATGSPARWFFASLIMLVGLGAIVAGVALQLIVLGVVGFVAMLLALVFATNGNGAPGASATAGKKPKPAAKPRSGSFFEDRWNNRTGL